MRAIGTRSKKGFHFESYALRRCDAESVRQKSARCVSSGRAVFLLLAGHSALSSVESNLDVTRFRCTNFPMFILFFSSGGNETEMADVAWWLDDADWTSNVKVGNN